MLRNIYGGIKVQNSVKRFHMKQYKKLGEYFILNQEYQINCWEPIHLDRDFIVKAV